MDQVQLSAEIRNNLGKEYCQKLRQQGNIPAVLYGGGQESLPLMVNRQALEHLLASKTGENVLINLTLTNLKATPSQTVILKEKQRHPVKGNMLHVDFCRISLEENLVVNVPLDFIGEAKGVKEGGLLEHHIWEIEIECLPALMPERIEVDISQLGIGQYLSVKDLTLNEGLKALDDPDKKIVSVVVPKEEKVEEAVVGEESAEPEVIREKKRPEKEEELGG